MLELNWICGRCLLCFIWAKLKRNPELFAILYYLNKRSQIYFQIAFFNLFQRFNSFFKCLIDFLILFIVPLVSFTHFILIFELKLLYVEGNLILYFIALLQMLWINLCAVNLLVRVNGNVNTLETLFKLSGINKC